MTGPGIVLSSMPHKPMAHELSRTTPMISPILPEMVVLMGPQTTVSTASRGVSDSN